MSESEKPIIYLQYIGGNSRPHKEPNRRAGWGEFFKAQSLVEESIEDGSRQVVFKTSEISPKGVMVVEASPTGAKELRNIANPKPERAAAHLRLVGKIMTELREMEPKAALYLWQINATQSPPLKSPSDLDKSPRERLKRIPSLNSQRVGTLHSHCDAIGGEFLPITSLEQSKEVHKKHLIEMGVAVEDAELKAQEFVELKRRVIKPRVFYRIFADFWEKELAPNLVRTYPNLFEKLEKTEIAQRPPLPQGSLRLKGGYTSFENPDFAQAVQLVHKEISRNWKTFADFIQSLSRLHRARNQKKIDEAITLFAKAHPWAANYEERFKSLARVVKADRRKVKDKQMWLHREFNFTQGVLEWNGGPVVFYVDPTPDTTSGVEAANVHAVRESRELTPEEWALRIKFRAELIRRLTAKNPYLRVGPEGRHTLEEDAILTPR